MVHQPDEELVLVEPIGRRRDRHRPGSACPPVLSGPVWRTGPQEGEWRLQRLDATIARPRDLLQRSAARETRSRAHARASSAQRPRISGRTRAQKGQVYEGSLPAGRAWPTVARVSVPPPRIVNVGGCSCRCGRRSWCWSHLRAADRLLPPAPCRSVRAEQGLWRVVLFLVVPLVTLLLLRERPGEYGLRAGAWRAGLVLLLIGWSW